MLLCRIGRLLLRLLKAVVGYPLYWLSGFILRDRKIWVFGSYGIFNDNSRYLYQFILNNPKFNIRAIWISKNKNSVLEAKKYGEAYWLYSLKGIYYSLCSGVYVFSAYVHDINFFLSRKSYKVNLWHGIPLKKIEFDIETKPLVNFFRGANVFYKFLYPHLHIKYDLVLSPSRFVANYSFKSAFRLQDENIIIAPYPRLMFWGDRKADIDVDCIKKYKKIFFYAPTWRDCDNEKDISFLNGIDFGLLNDLMMQNNSLLIVKFHSATKYNREYFSNFNFIKIIDNSLDPINVLVNVDVLITDYSSIYFDFLYLSQAKKIIIYFSFDLEQYLSGREMYFTYADVTPGPKVYSFGDLLVILRNILMGSYIDNHCYDRDQVNRLFNDYLVNKVDGDLIVGGILNRLKL